MAKKLMTVNWEDLRVGDEFPDSGAVITELWPWQESPCYELRTKNKKIIDGEEIFVDESVIASKDHLFSIVTEKSFDEYEITKASKEQTNKQAINWIACEDAYNIFKTAKTEVIDGTEVNLAIVPGTLSEITIVPYKNLEPQKCRCITTTHGTFTISNVLFGQTARGAHSLDAMKDIVYNLINVAGMSEEWVSQNLYLDLESIKRMQQLSGLKAAMNDIDDCDMAWSPEKDDSYQRKMAAYLTREATKYIEIYKAEHPDEPIEATGTAVDIACELGFDQEEIMKQHADEYQEFLKASTN